MEPRFSVILPTFGRPAFLRDALASVLAQTEKDWEVLVVDDASPEPVELATGDPRVRIVRRQRNGGPAAARNTGLAEARGRYVTFLDDDDLYTPDRLELALPALDRAPVAVCWSRFVGEDGPVRLRVLEGDVRHVILEDLVPHVGRTTVRRDLVPRFDEGMPSGDDVDWWFRLAHAAPVATVPLVGYLYRRHTGPRHGNTLDVRFRQHSRLLDRYADYFRTHPRAHAYRLRRVGLLALAAGDRKAARAAFRRSLAVRPGARSAWHLVRSLVSGRAVPEPAEEVSASS